ncbi:jg4403 [Pararge aegeria aegeria]|uniref:Regulatory protein zeste n=1 Tax=Pararge aegeria aegeria TaxID=348720 RepID=A0A8S4SJE7_9NEOP|nr:jg4403 [Pararge aegeria aegeria]
MSTPLKIKKAMSRDEVSLLVDLVVKRPAITTKETNAATNKLKEDAWNSLAVEFNKISDQARSKEQIKLKWDNLKKAARKRVSQRSRTRIHHELV